MPFDIQVNDKKIYDQKTDCFTFLFEEGYAPADIIPFEKAYGINLAAILHHHKFDGKYLETLYVPVISNDKLYHIMFVGLGKPKKKKIDVEMLRRAVGHLYKKVAAHKAKSFALRVPPAKLFGLSAQELGQQMAVALHMTAYHFDEYITDKDRKEKHVAKALLCVSSKDLSAFKKGVKTGDIIAVTDG